MFCVIGRFTVLLFFFFKQKTAYETYYGLVGSEMCKRDRARLDARRFDVQSLVLCPTRELADQVTVEIRRLARAEENIKIVTLCGGIALRGQRASLEHGAHIVVGTPGRIMDHLERGYLNLESLNTLVLDEADRMLDMGFFDDIATVVKQIPKERQTLLFSATYPEGIEKLARCARGAKTAATFTALLLLQPSTVRAPPRLARESL